MERYSVLANKIAHKRPAFAYGDDRAVRLEGDWMLNSACKSGLIAALTATGPTPKEMQAMPGVAKVEAAVQADNPARRIIRILDWQHVPREDFAADMRDALGAVQDEQIDEAYAKHLDRVAAVQKAQRAILAAFAERHGVRAVFIQGLTERDVTLLQVLAGVHRRRGGRELGLELRLIAGLTARHVAKEDFKHVLCDP